MAPKILVFAGSIRSGAFSGKTADVAQKELAMQGAEVTRISLADYTLPIMDQDLEKAEGIPDNAYRLARFIATHDAVLIATPEYNSSLPPLLKNAIDWISRIKIDDGKPLRPLPGKLMAICSSSPGHFGGIRAASHLRQILAHIQVEVIAPQCSVTNAEEAFDEHGEFREERMRRSMTNVCKALVERAWHVGENRRP
jgi:chromate reductase